MINPNDYIKNYSYIVQFSAEDEAYLSKCIELGIMAHGDTQEEAIQEIREAVRVHLLMLVEDGNSIPEPQSMIIKL